MRLVDLDGGGGDLGRLVWPSVAIVVAVVASFFVVINRQPQARIAPPASSETPGATGGVFVHVAGHVRRPGLYELPLGARVADAIQAAGGARRGALVDALNLAQVVIDGAKIEVARRQGDAGSPVVASEASAPGTISINTASQPDLETIPGIGPVKAGAIIAHREQIGGFQAIEDLLDVTGIGPATLEAIRSYVSL